VGNAHEIKMRRYSLNSTTMERVRCGPCILSKSPKDGKTDIGSLWKVSSLGSLGPCLGSISTSSKLDEFDMREPSVLAKKREGKTTWRDAQAAQLSELAEPRVSMTELSFITV
jgi:hypothetical protein